MDGYLGLALRALHLLGVVAWIGGILAVGLMVAFADDESRRGAAEAARKVALFVVSPGMLVAWAVGLVVLIPNFGAVYAKAGWMHGKLTLAFIATGMTGALSGMLRKLASGEDVKSQKLRVLALIIFIIGAIVIALVRLQPGGVG